MAWPTCSKTMSGASPRISLTFLANSRETLKRAFSSSGRLAALAHHARELVAVDVVDGAEPLDQLALLGRGDDADRVGAGRLAELGREHAEPAGGAPDQHVVAGLELALVDQHPVGGEVGEAVGARLRPGEVLGLRQQLLGLDLGELGERAPGRLVAPDHLAGRGERVEAVDLDVLVGGLVAVEHDLVAGLPLGHALADLPDDAGAVGAADVVAELLVVAVAEDADGLAERGPDVVEVDARGHHPHDHLEGAGLRHVDLLDLEGVGRLALALLPDHPGGHLLGQLPGLHVELRNVCDLYCQVDSLRRLRTAGIVVNPAPPRLRRRVSGSVPRRDYLDEFPWKPPRSHNSRSTAISRPATVRALDDRLVIEQLDRQRRARRAARARPPEGRAGAVAHGRRRDRDRRPGARPRGHRGRGRFRARGVRAPGLRAAGAAHALAGGR